MPWFFRAFPIDCESLAANPMGYNTDYAWLKAPQRTSGPALICVFQHGTQQRGESVWHCAGDVGIDLTERTQMVVVTDQDLFVLARKTFRCRAGDLGAALGWAADQLSGALNQGRPGVAGGISRRGEYRRLTRGPCVFRFGVVITPRSGRRYEGVRSR
jgi:hypothetical protein